MAEHDRTLGSIEDCAYMEYLRSGPHKPSPDDRIYTVRIKMLGACETMVPHLRTRMARKGELISFGHDGEWETARLRSSKVTLADLKRMGDENGYAMEIVHQA